MLKVEHIGIAVKDFETAVPLFEKLLNTECYWEVCCNRHCSDTRTV